MKHIRPENKNTIAILCMNGKSGANKKIKNDKTNDVIAAIRTLKVLDSKKGRPEKLLGFLE